VQTTGGRERNRSPPLRHPDSLDEDEKAKLSQVQARCPHLDALAGQVTEFAKILTGRHGERLDAWITAADASDLPDLHSFTTGIKRDYDAVLNGLTRPTPQQRSRQRQPAQDDQMADVWPRRIRPVSESSSR
jgi:transposase